MDITTIIASATALLTSIAALGGAAIKLRSTLAPLWRRRDLKVCVVAQRGDPDARSWTAGLRKAGYRDVALTMAASGCAGAGAVVLYRPGPDVAVELLDEVQAIAPEATVLVLTSDRLPLRPSDRVLLSQSSIRMRSDLAAVAEGGAE